MHMHPYRTGDPSAPATQRRVRVTCTILRALDDRPEHMNDTVTEIISIGDALERTRSERDSAHTGRTVVYAKPTDRP